jgi:hypothetical protein
MGDQGAARALFLRRVRRLARRARLRNVLRRGSVGLFFGLLPGCAAVLLAGTVPLPSLALACASAAAGLCAGALAGLLGRVDRVRLLIDADRVLGSRELTSTAYELNRRGEEGAAGGAFTAAITDDAADLLARSSPRRILGRVRLPFAWALPALAALIVLGLLFPVDLRVLFAPRSDRPAELALIGEDLRRHGERLREAARAGDVGRSLALSQELAQLGGELAERGMEEEEALERMADLESRIGREYQLRLQEVLKEARSGAKGGPRSRGDASGQLAPSGSGGQGSEGEGAGAPGASDRELSDLGGMLDKLNEARRRLRSPSEGEPGPGGSSTAGNPEQRGGEGRGSDGRSPGAGSSLQQPDSEGDGEGEDGQQGSGMDRQDGGGSGPGLSPSPDKRGQPTEIARGDAGPSLQAQGSLGEGESTRLLARALPEWTGSALPEAQVLGSYARQAESALSRDEVPLELKEFVKEYFTAIGISKGGAGE